MPKPKKKFDAPKSLWVIFDVDTSHPVMVFKDPDEATADLLDNGKEVVVKYTLPKEK